MQYCNTAIVLKSIAICNIFRKYCNTFAIFSKYTNHYIIHLVKCHMFYSGPARICYITQLKLGLKSYKKNPQISWFCKSNIDPKNIAKILKYFMQYWESIAILHILKKYCNTLATFLSFYKVVFSSNWIFKKLLFNQL